MSRRRRIDLYTVARRVNDVRIIASGNPRRIARRARNIAVGRALGRAGVWRLLWGSGRSKRGR